MTMVPPQQRPVLQFFRVVEPSELRRNRRESEVVAENIHQISDRSFQCGSIALMKPAFARPEHDRDKMEAMVAISTTAAARCNDPRRCKVALPKATGAGPRTHQDI